MRLTQSTEGPWVVVEVLRERHMVTIPAGTARYFVAGTGDASCVAAADFAVRFKIGRQWAARHLAVFYFTTDGRTIDPDGWFVASLERLETPCSKR